VKPRWSRSHRRIGGRIALVVAIGPLSGIVHACAASDSIPLGPPTHSRDQLFTDSNVPHCDGGVGNYQLSGQIDGQAIQFGTTLVSNLDPQGFQILEVVDGAVRTDLALTWSEPLAEDTAIPLTGASILIPQGQPSGGQSLCITQGKFGSPALGAGAAGRQLLFRITGARKGDCAGAEVRIELDGCVFRTNTYFPVPKPADAGLQFTTDAAPPSIDPATQLVDLTHDEMAALCDWEATALGGYGTVTDCQGEGYGSTVQNLDNQAQCIDVVFGEACPGRTVGDLEACILARVPKRSCVYQEVCERIAGRCEHRDL
jgi:hypothetical protein